LVKVYYEASGRQREQSSGTEDLEESIEAKNASTSSLDVFGALFCDQKEFCSRSAAVNYLEQYRSRNHLIIKEMNIWVQGLLGKHTNADGTTFRQASTAQTLIRDITPFTSAVAESEGEEVAPSLWPLVKKIKFGLDNPLLNDGVVLVDLPGLRDSNKTRNVNVSKALRDCTHYYIVADIKRVQDDATVSDYMMRGYQSKSNDRVTVVCTHTDVIDENSRPEGAKPKEMETLGSLLE
jgi:hypothetical protein